MLFTYKKFMTLILFMGYLYGVQSKECYSCEGINCLRTSKIANKATCTDSVDSCVTVFEESTVIARGCYSNLPENYRNKCDSTSDLGCHKCYKNLCNDRGAISCLQCNSQDNKDCSKAVANIDSTRCPVSTSVNSYCFTRKSTNNIERGCLIDSSEQLKCLGDSSCEMCIPSNDQACNREEQSLSGGDDDNHVISGSKRVTIYGAIILLTWFTSMFL